jgi:hypothetical protein
MNIYGKSHFFNKCYEKTGYLHAERGHWTLFHLYTKITQNELTLNERPEMAKLLIQSRWETSMPMA